jgi:nitrite reductase/ring-hydroxylating ferredoxin subunit
MAWRKDAYLNGDRSRIVCSAHGAQFDIETGVCTLGPCLGQSLTSVLLEVDDSGAIRLAST